MKSIIIDNILWILKGFSYFLCFVRESIACLSAVVIPEMLIGSGDFIKGDLTSSNLSEMFVKRQISAKLGRDEWILSRERRQSLITVVEFILWVSKETFAKGRCGFVDDLIYTKRIRSSIFLLSKHVVMRLVFD